MPSNKYSKKDCLSALIEAEEILGHEPSQHEYKELDLSPSYQTIANKFGRWNIAKREAGMDENKPSHLEYQNGCPNILSYTDTEWKELDKNIRFRRRNQARIALKKLESGCRQCGYDNNPAALELHHKNPDNKFMAVSTMITQGYSSDKINEEVEKCVVLCANCHSLEESGDIYDI
jgi:hypothetical protein